MDMVYKQLRQCPASQSVVQHCIFFPLKLNSPEVNEDRHTFNIGNVL